jgi:hypothetical protein
MRCVAYHSGRAAILCLAVSSAIAAESPRKSDAGTEPPVQYLLRVGDQEFPLELDSEVTLPVRMDEPKIRLSARPHCVFPHAGVTLPYPREFIFEADIDEDVSIWTLSGNDAKIMIFHYTSLMVALDTVVDQALEQFGRENCRRQPARIQIQGHVVTGARIDATLAGTLIRSDIFRMPTRRGTRILWLQDAPGEDGNPSDEARNIRSLIEQQMQLDEPR